MKIELIERQNWNGLKYIIKVNDFPEYVFADKEVAVLKYDLLVEQAKKKQSEIVLKSFEI